MFRLSVFPVHFPEKTRNPETVTETHGLTLQAYITETLSNIILFSHNNVKCSAKDDTRRDGRTNMILLLTFPFGRRSTFSANNILGIFQAGCEQIEKEGKREIELYFLKYL